MNAIINSGNLKYILSVALLPSTALIPFNGIVQVSNFPCIDDSLASLD